jgi:KUP system potassium uptake protein
LISLEIYGDIGTSIICNESHTWNTYIINADVVLGGISAVFGLYPQTTIKYVLITFSADNHGEGGILHFMLW